MSTMTYSAITCDHCGRQHELADTKKDALESARLDGWIRRRVTNGSMWDFCTMCIAWHEKEAGE